MLKSKKGHNSASTPPTEKEKYGSANFHKQLVYETLKLFHICFISSVSSLRGAYTSTKIALWVMQFKVGQYRKRTRVIILQKKKKKKKEKRHNNIFSTEKNTGQLSFHMKFPYPSKHVFLKSLTHQKRNEQTNG